MTPEDSSDTETNVSAEDAPYAAPETEPTAGSGVSKLRLLPAVVIVLATWAIAVIPGLIRPLTFMHFVSMQGAPALGALALLVWWLASRALPMRQRLIGAGVVIVTYIAGVFAGHSSMHVVMYVYGLPIVLSLLVAGMLVAKKLKWPKQGWVAYLAIAVFLAASLFVRVGEMDAAFAFTLVPRSQPTAEEQFLRDAESQPTRVATDSTSDLSLPVGGEELVWAEFRGPHRDSAVAGVNLSTDWKTRPPKEIWRRKVGPGWSSFCIAGPLLITQEQRGQNEAVVAYMASDGSPVWNYQYPGRFEAAMGGVGPRATPTYRDQRLYVMGANGQVFCLDATNGKRVWEYDLVKQLKAPVPDWGFASSPLVLDETVVVFSGAGVNKGTIALTKDEGNLIWSGGDGTKGYSSPQLSVLHDVPQILVSSNRGVRSFNHKTGKLLWQHDWDIGVMARVTQPIVNHNVVYLGTGYGNGTQRFDVHFADGKWTTDEKWTVSMKPYFNDAVFHQGYIYGFDGPIFMCIDADDGSKAWKRGRYGHGQVLLLRDQDLMLVITEKGELVLLKTNPDKLEELAKLQAVEGVTWNHPVIANGKLFVRNAKEMVCYDLQ